MNYEKWNDRYLKLAQFISTWSKDPSSQVGSVIVNRDNEIVSMGFNGFPRGIKDTDERLITREEKLKLILHAEQNALLFAKQSVKKCSIYVYPYLPCNDCAKLIIQAQIRDVHAPVSNVERWNANFEYSLAVFKEASVNVYLYESKNGIFRTTSLPVDFDLCSTSKGRAGCEGMLSKG